MYSWVLALGTAGLRGCLPAPLFLGAEVAVGLSPLVAGCATLLVVTAGTAAVLHGAGAGVGIATIILLCASAVGTVISVLTGSAVAGLVGLDTVTVTLISPVADCWSLVVSTGWFVSVTTSACLLVPP